MAQGGHNPSSMSHHQHPTYEHTMSISSSACVSQLENPKNLAAATATDLHTLVTESLKTGGGNNTLGGYRDEKHQILDILCSGKESASDQDVIGHQIMMKRLETELDRSPKRLRSIMMQNNF